MQNHRAGTAVLLVGLVLLAVGPARGQEAADYGREVPLTGLSEMACRDVFEIAVHEALVKLNYRKAPRDDPDKTGDLTRHAYLVRPEEGEAERVLIVGLKSYATQDSRIYLWGAVPGAERPQPNPDLEALAAAVQQAAQKPQESPRKFSVRELVHDTYELSCIDMKSCIEILGMLGYTTTAPSGEVDIGQLPAAFALPFASVVPVVGQSSIDEKKKPDEVALTEETLSAPLHRLMILYHSSQTEEVGKLKDLLVETIDVPDRQVLIEGMIIELTEDDLKELGAEWELFREDWLRLTFLSAETEAPFLLSYNPESTPPAGLANRIRATLRMVIQEGKAEVLSSPSVLVLNNRNARIKIVRDTPIISTKITFDIQSVDVRFEPVGIVLNIKPRISQDGSTVTMQIVAEVSEVPAGEAIVVQGTEVAPAIDRRIVETIARVHNNTPFIIGGLIRNEKARTLDRIPILSRIPILGVLFRKSVTIREKREVIIVLTPRVIMPGGTQRPVLPKDADRFDFLNNRLFRNTYRVKGEDVFDLPLLENNETILWAFERARALVRRHPEYGGESPFREFAARIIPGEDAVVLRMLFEIIRDKLALHERLETKNLIVFEKNESKPAGFKVRFLEDSRGTGILQEASPDGTVEGYFDEGRPYPRDVMLLHFKLDPEGGLRAALDSPVVEIEWVTVTDPKDDAVEKRLLEINRLGDDYRHHDLALALGDKKDLVRLKACIVLREVAKVNNFEALLALRNFRVGRRFVIPELDSTDERIFLIDHCVAEFFFKSDYYYSALRDRLEKGFEMLEQALAREGM